MWAIEVKADSENGSALQEIVANGKFPAQAEVNNDSTRLAIFPELGLVVKVGQAVKVDIPDPHILVRLVTDAQDFVGRWGGSLTVKQI
jgi:hypothetical protein